jgi:branched-chain amino acid transport system substrate-binding protein
MNPTDVGCGRQAETHPVRRAVLRATTLAVLGPLALLPARTHAAEAGATEILIGQSAQLSGPLAPLTRELIQGASWYFDEVNGKGGVHGRKVRVITLDDGYVAARTAENVKRLIDDDKVLALFNLAGTPTTLAALPILEERKVPLVAPFTGSGALRKKLNPQVFNVRAGYDDELEQIVRHLSTLGVTQVAVAYLNNTFGKDALATAERAAAAHRASLVASAALEVDGKGLDASVRSIA